MNNLKTLKISIYFILLILFTVSNQAYSQIGWNQQFLNTNECLVINFPSSDTGYIFQNRGNLFKTTNSGTSWFIIDPPGIQSIGPGKFSTNVLGIVRGIPSKLTTNGGLSWTDVSNELPSFGGAYTYTQQFVNSNTGYYAGIDVYPNPIPCCYDGVIYKSTNSGMSWNLVYRLGGIEFQELYFKDENLGVVLDEGALVSTSDGGQNWNRNNSIVYDVRYFHSMSMTNPFKDTIYISGIKRSGGADTAAVIKSIDNGNSWFFSLQLSFRSSLRKIFFIDNNLGYAVGDTGLIVKTTNGGENWTVLNSGTRKDLNDVSFINKDTGFVIGDSGLVLTTFTGGLVNINNELSLIPESFSLSQNYPNPFNPVTNLGFGISDFGFVSLKVYDILGNEVAVLVNENKEPGYYNVQFDGSKLSSGIYFYRLESNGFVQTKRMMMVK